MKTFLTYISEEKQIISEGIRQGLPHITTMDHDQFTSLTHGGKVHVEGATEKTDGSTFKFGHDEDGFYWQTHVEVLRNNYHYNSGIGIFDEILRFLVNKSIEQLEPKAIDIYNYHWPPEAHE